MTPSDYTVLVRPEYVVISHVDSAGSRVQWQIDRESAVALFEAGYVAIFSPRRRLPETLDRLVPEAPQIGQGPRARPGAHLRKRLSKKSTRPPGEGGRVGRR